MAASIFAGGNLRGSGEPGAKGTEPDAAAVLQNMFVPAECPYTATGLSMLPHNAELIEYYRKRCEEFTQLEEDYIARLQILEGSIEERHRARWQHLRTEAEVQDLQAALSDAKVALFEEKERVTALREENDALKLQELEDRQRIQQLLSLTQPVTEEITLFKGQAPSHLITGQRLIEAELNAPQSIKVGTGLGGVGGGDGSMAGGMRVAECEKMNNPEASFSSLSVRSGPVLRTVFLPSQSADSLSLELQALKLQAQEQRTVWREKEEVLLEDRRVKKAEVEQMRQRHAAQVWELEEKLRGLEGELSAVTRDYLLIRHQSGKQVEAMQEEASAAKRRCETLLEQFQAMSDKRAADVEMAVKAAHDRSHEIVRAHEEQTQEAEEALLALKTQMAADSLQAQQREAAASAALSKIRSQHSSLHAQRAQDASGARQDLLALKRQLRPLIPALHQLLRQHGHGGAAGQTASQPGPGLVKKVRPESVGGSVKCARTAPADAREGRGNVIRVPIGGRDEGKERVSAEKILEQLEAITQALDGMESRLPAHRKKKADASAPAPEPPQGAAAS